MGRIRPWRLASVAALAVGVLAGSASAQPARTVPDAAKVELRWGVKVPLRDG